MSTPNTPPRRRLWAWLWRCRHRGPVVDATSDAAHVRCLDCGRAVWLARQDVEAAFTTRLLTVETLRAYYRQRLTEAA